MIVPAILGLFFSTFPLVVGMADDLCLYLKMPLQQARENDKISEGLTYINEYYMSANLCVIFALIKF